MRNLRWNNRDLVHLDDFFADLYVDHSFPRRLNNTLRQQENDSVDTYNQVNSRQAKGKKRLEHKYLGVTISTSPIIGGSIEYMENIWRISITRCLCTSPVSSWLRINLDLGTTMLPTIKHGGFKWICLPQ